MAGLRKRQKEKRESEILSAASGLFLEKGYEASTINEVAALAGVSNVTVFNYYETKGDLLLALIAKETSKINRKIKRILDKTDIDPIDKSCMFFETIYIESLRIVDRNSWINVIISSINKPDSKFSHEYSMMRDGLKSQFGELLKRLVSEGKLRSGQDVDTLMEVAYAYHYQLFTETVSNESKTFDYYKSELRRGLTLLLNC